MTPLHPIIKRIDEALPILGKLGRATWIEAQNARRQLSTRPHYVDSDAKAVLEGLEREGVHVVERYLDAAHCQRLRDAIDKGLEDHADAVWVDDVGSDRRLFGAERVIPAIATLFEDDFVRRTIDAYQRSERVEGFAMCARMEYVPDNPGSGAGWHRDDALHSQAKAIFYLSDVGPDNGPFQYLPRSHKGARVVYDMVRGGLEHGQFRFSDAQVEALESTWPGYERATVMGPEGSLVFADTRGIHRGSPMKDGVRYAITFYLWFDQPIPEHIAAKLVEP